MKKQCTKCKQIKPCKDFAPDSRNRNGLQSWCRKCMTVWHKKYYHHNSKVRERLYASCQVRRAVAKGQLHKAKHCSMCGADNDLEAHHPDGYSDPYNIIWLCRLCHAGTRNYSKEAG